MTPTASSDCEARAADYLAAMCALGDELERAIQAIAENSLTDLEESVAHQQELSVKLHTLADGLSAQLDDDAPISTPLSGDIVYQIHAATEVLQNLNLCYAALLRHSSRGTGQMTALFQTFQGQESVSPGTKRQTWSCSV
jgi:hypothetical protein